MSFIVIIFFVLTAIFVALGLILGSKRGLKRSVLRIVLVLLSALFAFLFRETFSATLLKINIPADGKKVAVEEYFGNIITAMPSSSGISDAEKKAQTQKIMDNLAMPIARSIANVIAFVFLFYMLKLLTLIIYFVLAKILFKKEEDKKAMLGMVVGFVQSVIVSLCICGPLAGFVAMSGKIIKTVDAITSSADKSSENKNSDKYDNIKNAVMNFDQTAIGKFYVNGFKGLFEMVASTKVTVKENGEEKVKNFKLTESVEAIDSVGNAAKELSGTLEKISDIDLSNPNSMNDLKNLCAKLDNINAEMSDGAKDTVKTAIVIAIDSVSIPENDEFVKNNSKFIADFKTALKETNFSDINFSDEFKVVEDMKEILEKESNISKNDLEVMTKELANSKLILPILNNIENSNLNLNATTKKEIEKTFNDLDFENQKEEEAAESIKKLLGL